MNYQYDLDGLKQYELTNHLGNVLTTVTDKHIGLDGDNDGHADSYLPEISSQNDYYPGGMVMPERNFTASKYRFGLNGQEKTDEFSGAGNHNTAQFWEYDTRLGRRWNLDPIDQVSVSNYASFLNNPLINTDVKGNKAGDTDDKITCNDDGFVTNVEQASGPDEIFNERGDKLTTNDPSLDKSQVEDRKAVGERLFVPLSNSGLANIYNKRNIGKNFKSLTPPIDFFIIICSIRKSSQSDRCNVCIRS